MVNDWSHKERQQVNPFLFFLPWRKERAMLARMHTILSLIVLRTARQSAENFLKERNLEAIFIRKNYILWTAVAATVKYKRTNRHSVNAFITDVRFNWNDKWIYMVTSEAGNKRTKKTNIYKTAVKKVLNFIELNVIKFAKTTHNYFWPKLIIKHGPGT